MKAIIDININLLVKLHRDEQSLFSVFDFDADHRLLIASQRGIDAVGRSKQRVHRELPSADPRDDDSSAGLLRVRHDDAPGLQPQHVRMETRSC